jgi:hypothetical protein
MHIFWAGIALLLVGFGLLPILSVLAPGLLVSIFVYPILMQVAFIGIGLAFIGIDLGTGKKNGS